MVSLHNKYLPAAQVPDVSGITDFEEKERDKRTSVKWKCFFYFSDVGSVMHAVH